MADSLKMRRALMTVPIAARAAWARDNAAPCNACKSDACAYPSHWSGERLKSAFTALRMVTEEPASDQDDSATEDSAVRLVNALRAVVANSAPDLSKVEWMIEAAKAEIVATFANRAPLLVKVADRPAVDIGLAHKQFPLLLAMVAAGDHVWIAGPAGSGKTTAAEQVAQALSLPFYFNGAIDTEYKLSGFVDANGRIVSTAFRRAYTDGGVYLFDEADASLAPALLAFNAALANGHADFPGLETPVKKHAAFHCMAGANTFGHGGTFEYVGRARMDGAFLDRFSMLRWDYDAELERALAGNDKWTAHVQRLRSKAAERGLKVIISPRASIRGARKLAAGLSWDDIVTTEIANRMTPADYTALTR